MKHLCFKIKQIYNYVITEAAIYATIYLYYCS
nr:MAG TPA: hypothetical protein [Caudoviricetes sp.]DAY82653.1 MAG TPA: hypothetical protein [Caudoviricetes sp.]